MRGFLFGMIVVPTLVISVLSMRPGGLRQGLRSAARRLRLALVLAGIYLVLSATLQLAVPGTQIEEYGLPGLAVVLGVVFIVLGQDRDETRRGGNPGSPPWALPYGEGGHSPLAGPGEALPPSQVPA